MCVFVCVNVCLEKKLCVCVCVHVFVYLLCVFYVDTASLCVSVCYSAMCVYLCVRVCGFAFAFGIRCLIGMKAWTASRNTEAESKWKAVEYQLTCTAFDSLHDELTHTAKM